MIRLSAVTATLAAALLAACNFDAEIGSHALSDGDGGVDATAVPRGATVYTPGAHTILLDGDHLILSSSIPETAPGSTSPWHDAIVRVLPNGTPEVIADVSAGAMVADATTLYAAVADPGSSPATMSILAIDRTTHATTVVSAARPRIRDLALDGAWLYVAEREPADPGLERVVRLATDGSTETALLTGLDAAGAMALDATHLFVADDAGLAPGRLLAVPKAGGPTVTLADDLDRPAGVLVHGDWLYVAIRADLPGDGAIARIRRPAVQSPDTLATLVTGLGFPTYLAADSTHVYWSAYFSGAQRAPLTGGTAETLSICGHDDPIFPGPPPPSQGCGHLALAPDAVYLSARNPQGHSIVLGIDL